METGVLSSIDPALPSGSPCGSCSSWAPKAAGMCVCPEKSMTNPWSLTYSLEGPGGPIGPQTQIPRLSFAFHIPVDFLWSTTNQVYFMPPFLILTSGVHRHPQGLTHLPRSMCTPGRPSPRGTW